MKIRLYKTILGRTVQKLAKKGFYARDFRCNSILLVAKQIANLKKNKNIRIMVVFVVPLCDVMKYTPKRCFEKIIKISHKTNRVNWQLLTGRRRFCVLSGECGLMAWAG